LKKIRMTEQNLFEELLDSLKFDIDTFIVEGKIDEIPEYMKKSIEEATFIMKQNIIGDLKIFGGSVTKNKEKFEELTKKLKEEIERDKFKDIKKELKDLEKKFKEYIEKSCGVIIPVKELPWKDVIFYTIPRLLYDKKVQLLDNTITYCGEIECLVSKTTVFGKMKDQEPLFAPLIGELDLGGFHIESSEKKPTSQIYSYIMAIIKSFDANSARNQVAKYHESYQRHGEPICDFLMKNRDAMEAMTKIESGLDSKRLNHEISICAMALPQKSDNTSLMIVTDESKLETGKYSRCFEGFLKFSAACCEAPSTTKGGDMVEALSTSGVRTPGGQQLSAWTAEELAEEAQKRGTGAPNMPAWTEEELIKNSEQRSSGLPEGMEYWKEEELMELAKKRQGGTLDIPEWVPDPEMKECLNCGYSLRKGWDECPVCGTPVGQKALTKPSDSEPSEKESETEGNESSETKAPNELPQNPDNHTEKNN
ncbi:MAG: hypothetical protein JW891_06415, partial [Candidatus Lokiarchaeota archaeon]|nr:hypothetical protein [Candidatus Lokiarchaeota archaeon]